MFNPKHFILSTVEEGHALLRKNRMQARVEQEDVRFSTSRVLIVEDIATYRQFLCEELKQEGYEITKVTTAAEALELLMLQKFDAVVLDISLPDMSGEQMCCHFSDIRRALDQAFVLLMLTGKEDKEEMNAVIAAGADDVIVKSRDSAIIKSRLLALIRRKQLDEKKQHIVSEFQQKKNALIRERAEKKVTEEREAQADRLAQTNRELKEAQSQLVQSAKMASLGELVAGVAHEINNPLAFVISHLNTIKNSINAVLPEVEENLSEQSRNKFNKLQQRTDDMQTGLERIKDLVVKLRTFSRLDEGEFKQVNIKECIESVLTLLQHRLQERIDVVKKYNGNNMIHCYPGLLNQVFMNVIANAIDAIEGQGKITITTQKNGSIFSVAIADSGSGIPDAVRDRIFDPFFTTKPVGQGTGLGLSISYGIIKKHGGEFDIHDNQGGGTEMVISIPQNETVIN